MWRWFLSTLLFLAGVGVVALGIYIELEVQYEVGNWEGAANQFYGGEIREYRDQVWQCLVGGPLLLVLAYCFRPRFQSKDKDGGRTKKTEPWPR